MTFQDDKDDIYSTGTPPSQKRCSMCNHIDYIYSIRGVEACIHCHFDRIWDFMEGTRRIMRGEE